MTGGGHMDAKEYAERVIDLENDMIIKWLVDNGLEVNVENYVDICWFGDEPPADELAFIKSILEDPN
jgi:hypothetical protein